MAFKTIRMRLYPTEEQKDFFKKNFDCCRFVYNWALNATEECYEYTGEHLHPNELSSMLTKIKHTEEYSFLEEADAYSLQRVLINLDEAYNKYFKGSYGKPVFKKKKANKESYFPATQTLHVRGNKVKLPKIGYIDCSNSYNIDDKHWYNATVKKENDGKYFITLTYDDTSIDRAPFMIIRNIIGIDVGINPLFAFSNGDKEYLPDFVKKSYPRLDKLRKSLSRKSSGSNNEEKARIRLAKAEKKISNRMHDYINKLTTKLVNEYDEIHIEDYSVSEWIIGRSSNVNRVIYDLNLYRFKDQLKYKSKWKNKKLVIVDRNYPSTQLCSNCGFKNYEVKRKFLKNWTCPVCGCNHDRDINAAINLANYSA